MKYSLSLIKFAGNWYRGVAGRLTCLLMNRAVVMRCEGHKHFSPSRVLHEILEI
jgi:hypothetical protein